MQNFIPNFHDSSQSISVLSLFTCTFTQQEKLDDKSCNFEIQSHHLIQASYNKQRMFDFNKISEKRKNIQYIQFGYMNQTYSSQSICNSMQQFMNFIRATKSGVNKIGLNLINSVSPQENGNNKESLARTALSLQQENTKQ